MVDATQDAGLARVDLQPIAAPSILGLYGFSGVTFIVAAYLAGWYGDSKTAFYLFPFAAFFGGLVMAAGHLFITSAFFAWYTASALMLKGVGKGFLDRRDAGRKTSAGCRARPVRAGRQEGPVSIG